jgi:DNA-binding Lrp family transcriptional regulator
MAKEKIPSILSVRWVDSIKSRLIESLLNFRQRKKTSKKDETLESNINKDKIKEIFEDKKREEGWMDYVSLGKSIGISPGAVHSKIKTLVETNIIESSEIEYIPNYSKEIKTRRVYRLKKDIGVLDFLIRLAKYRFLKDQPFSFFYKKLGEPKEYSFFEQELVLTDYFSSLSYKTQSTWLKSVKANKIKKIDNLRKQTKIIDKISKEVKTVKNK